ncbi:MAG TPA: hypothetical protein ENG78_07090 [Acidiferrobacteraceae bacterium]|nr:hypothetical protein [Acidiferrobacteraceae bacterium]HEX20565.1 hypothetical protein [Acidiferrobacteraceae bacterium]
MWFEIAVIGVGVDPQDEFFGVAFRVELGGNDLELQYRYTLEALGKEGGMLGTIFRKAHKIPSSEHRK